MVDARVWHKSYSKPPKTALEHIPCVEIGFVTELKSDKIRPENLFSDLGNLKPQV